MARGKKVLEIVPGTGWYTEIISKYMNKSKNFYVLMYGKPRLEILKKIQKNFLDKFQNQNSFGDLKNIYFDEDLNIVHQDNYFDLVLTFRNTHNWLQIKKAETVYKSISRVLKKGEYLSGST